MNLFDKLSLKIYSIIVLILAIAIGITIMQVTTLAEITKFTEELINDNFYIAVGITAIAIVWSIRNIINGGKNPRENSSGVLLENKNGKLLITKESINNLIETVVHENKDISNVSTRLEFDENNNINVFLNITVKVGTSVKDVTADVQTRIKDAVKKTTDLDIKEINIKVKNIEQLGEINV